MALESGSNSPNLIDELCDDFESALNSGQLQSIENYLKRVPTLLYPAALARLVRIEIENRRGRNEPVSADDYGARFPLFKSAIMQAFDGQDPWATAPEARVANAANI